MEKRLEYNYENSLGTLTERSSRALGLRLLENFNQSQINHTIDEWRVLLVLWQQEGLGHNEIAIIIDKDKTNITRIIDNLEADEVVYRKVDSVDRRKKNVFLTEKGKELKEKLYEQGAITLTQALKGVSNDEVETCKRVLKTICKNLDYFCFLTEGK